MNDLAQVAVLDLGLICGSVSLAVLCSFAQTKAVDCTCRPSALNTAGQLVTASERKANDTGQI
jgi:hypothetical protein